MKIKFGTEPAIRSFLSEHKEWLEKVFSASLEELIVTQMDYGYALDIEAQISDTPPYSKIQNLRYVSSFDKDKSERKITSVTTLCVPAIIKISDTEGACYCNLPYWGGTRSVYTVSIFVCKKSNVKILSDFLYTKEVDRFSNNNFDYSPVVYVYNDDGNPIVKLGRHAKWSSITSSKSALVLRKDVESFHSHYKWYRDNAIVYRRSYLLYGPPGNGKTTCAAIIGSQHRMNIYTLNFGSPKADDSALSHVFTMAGNGSPSIVLLEDIDRIFGRASSTRTHVTFQNFLNCLDGVETPEGIIVIATANHPDELDAAILKRPGRFHKLIGFNNPSEEERKQYLTSMVSILKENEVEYLVAKTDRFSYAQLSEARTQAALNSLEQEGVLTFEALKETVESIKESYLDLKDKRLDKAGFKI